MNFHNEAGETITLNQFDSYIQRSRKLSETAIQKMWAKYEEILAGKPATYAKTTAEELADLKSGPHSKDVLIAVLLNVMTVFDFEELLRKLEYEEKQST